MTNKHRNDSGARLGRVEQERPRRLNHRLWALIALAPTVDSFALFVTDSRRLASTVNDTGIPNGRHATAHLGVHGGVFSTGV